MTLDQVEELLGSTRKEASTLVSTLKRKRLVTEARFHVSRVYVTDGPLAMSHESDPLSAKQVSELARVIRNRYGAPTIESVYSTGIFRRPLHVDHEIALAEVFLWYRKHRPEWTWVGEAPRRKDRVPDATVFGPAGQQVAIDFAGTYRATKIGALVLHYASTGTDLEFW